MTAPICWKKIKKEENKKYYYFYLSFIFQINKNTKNQNQKSMSSTKCGNCDAEGVVFCKECNALFCDKCNKAVHAIPIFSKHTRVQPSNSDPIPMCKNHPSSLAKYLCEDCKGNTTLTHTHT